MGKKEFSLVLKSEESKKIAFEQYKLLIDSINKLNETRENSSNFWIGVNTLAITAVAYVRESQNINFEHKAFILWTLIIVGSYLCLSWLSYLAMIKKSLETRHKLLVVLEANLPVPLFTQVFALSQEKPNKSPLTLREMAVPYLFIVGYLFLAILVLCFPSEVCPLLAMHLKHITSFYKKGLVFISKKYEKSAILYIHQMLLLPKNDHGSSDDNSVTP